MKKELKELTIELPKGKIIVKENPDPDYAGVSVIYQTEDELELDLVRVECAAVKDYETLNLFTWEDILTEDWTRKVEFPIANIEKALED